MAVRGHVEEGRADGFLNFLPAREQRCFGHCPVGAGKRPLTREDGHRGNQARFAWKRAR